MAWPHALQPTALRRMPLLSPCRRGAVPANSTIQHVARPGTGRSTPATTSLLPHATAPAPLLPSKPIPAQATSPLSPNLQPHTLIPHPHTTTLRPHAGIGDVQDPIPITAVHSGVRGLSPRSTTPPTHTTQAWNVRNRFPPLPLFHPHTHSSASGHWPPGLDAQNTQAQARTTQCRLHSQRPTISRIHPANTTGTPQEPATPHPPPPPL